MKRFQVYLVALVGLLCLVTAIRADEMKIEEFYEATGDLSASTKQRKDLNDNVCALVKVVLPLRGADFEGNVIGDVEFKSGEYWVYMSQGSKMLKVKHEDAKPIMIDFTDYGIPALESRTTYTLVITPPKKDDRKGDGANGSYLILDITPKTGIFVEVDGKPLPVEDGQISTFLEYGNHNFTVKAPGYDTYNGTAKIEKGVKTTIPVVLVSNMANLTVKPETSGASIKINGKQRGTGSFMESMAPGTYLIEVEKQGHQPWSETINLAEKENKTLSVPELQPIYGSLNVDFKPMGSTITIDGRQVDSTPAIIGNLLIGPHTVTISKDGYDTFSSQVSISEAETTNLTGTLSETTNLTGALSETTNLAGALSETPDIELLRQGKNGKWGFTDKTGKEVIPFKYDAVNTFSEGLASVKLNGKYGYIDKNGKEVIPFKYDRASSFSEGLAIVMLKGKHGYIDKTGKEVIPLKYDDAWSFSEGLAPVMLNGKIGYIDKTGKEVSTLKYDFVSRFSEDVAVVELNGKYGYIDKNGKEVIPLKYDNAISFSEGLAPVKLNGKWGFIDKTEKEVIPFKYDDAHVFKIGKALVKLNDRSFYIDKNGNEVK